MRLRELPARDEDEQMMLEVEFTQYGATKVRARKPASTVRVFRRGSSSSEARACSAMSRTRVTTRYQVASLGAHLA